VSLCCAFTLLGLAVLANWQQRPAQPDSSPRHTTAALCRPSSLRNFCRVGCPDQAPLLTRHVQPDTKRLKHPLPSGAIIVELGVDLQGEVVSACVIRGVRDDYDRAAQAAARQWRFKVPKLTGNERGFVLTVSVCTPDQRCNPKIENVQKSGGAVRSINRTASKKD
jgi:TonB family protein